MTTFETIAQYNFSSDLDLDNSKKFKMIQKIESILDDMGLKCYHDLKVTFNLNRKGNKVTPHIDIPSTLLICGEYIDILFQYDFESGYLGLSYKNDVSSWEIIRDCVSKYTDYHSTGLYYAIDYMLNDGAFPEFTNAYKMIRLIERNAGMVVCTKQF